MNDEFKKSGSGDVLIGKGGHINEGCWFHTVNKTQIIIGNYVRIGPNVQIFTKSYDTWQDMRNEEALLDYKRGSVVIKDGAWIGANCVILPNVTIGENAVIQANSVVTQDVPPNAVYGVRYAVAMYKEPTNED